MTDQFAVRFAHQVDSVNSLFMEVRILERTIHLIDFFWTRDKDPRIPLGHASLLSQLRKLDGIATHSHVEAVNQPSRSIEELIHAILSDANGKPSSDVDVAIGAYVWAEEQTRRCLKLLRQGGFAGRIVMGGPQISYCEGGLEALYPEADAFIRGYGEEALSAFVLSSEKRTIQGVHWAGDIDLALQSSIDFEALPSPWLEGVISLEERQFIRWETQRGCTFRCGFCQHREAGKRLLRREIGSSRIEQEIALFCASDVNDIAVLDPVFNMPQARSVEILRRFVDGGYRGKISLQCRAEAIKPPFLDVAALLETTLEFGLQTIHPKECQAVGRPNVLRLVHQTFKDALVRGLDCEVSLIFGLPHQTLESFKQSIQFCLDLQVPTIKAFPLLLLRGTPLEKSRNNWSLKTEDNEMPVVIQSDSMSFDDWHQMAQLSEALKFTEGNHPDDVDALMEIARGLKPHMPRWRP